MTAALAARGADAFARSSIDSTPAHEAAREGHPDCLRLIFDAVAGRYGSR
jgi:hypothetical protein